MTKITLHTSSIALFSSVKDNIDTCEKASGVTIELEYVNSEETSIQCNGGNINALPSLPIRLGSIFDLILRLISSSGDQFIQAESINIGSYVLHPRDMSLDDSKGKSITLTEKERDMILCIYRKEGHEIEKTELLSNVWGYGDNIETHTLETHIYRLRQKVESDPSQPKWLVTTDKGYRLNLS